MELVSHANCLPWCEQGREWHSHEAEVLSFHTGCIVRWQYVNPVLVQNWFKLKKISIILIISRLFKDWQKISLHANWYVVPVEKYTWDLDDIITSLQFWVALNVRSSTKIYQYITCYLSCSEFYVGILEPLKWNYVSNLSFALQWKYGSLNLVVYISGNCNTNCDHEQCH